MTNPRDLFPADYTPAQREEAFQKYLGALDTSAEKTAKGRFDYHGRPQMPPDALNDLTKTLDAAEVTKALSSETLQSITEQVTAARTSRADVVKDFTLTSPLATGYVAYDLEAPAKVLAPRPTPLRNRVSRKKGIGTAHQYKRVTGHTGTGTGGAGLTHPGITDSDTNTFGSLTLRRGPKISYAGDESTVPYLQFSLSDLVPWSAQFSGMGYQDIRQFSQTSVLYSSLLMEERLLLGGVGTASGFAGAPSAPGTPTISANRATVAGETGNTANIANIYAAATAVYTWGESALSTISSTSTTLSATTGKVVDVTVPSVPADALAVRLYVGASNSASALFAAGVTVAVTPGTSAPLTGVSHSGTGGGGGGTCVLTVNFDGAGTGGLPTAAYAAGDGSQVAAASSAQSYDGLLTYAGGANSGYRNRLDAPLSTSNPGDEFQVAFASLWDSVKADPDEISMNGFDRKQLSDVIKNGGTSNQGYRLTVSQSEVEGVTLGSVVTTLVNEVTGKDVSVSVHPWQTQGAAAIVSWTLPLPDSNVSDTFCAVNVQDYMAVQWPVLQFTYDVSSYWYGTAVCYAPAWYGFVSGIAKA